MGRSPTGSAQVPVAPLKHRLLEAALEPASRQGFSATSYQDMASLVGVTKQALNYHFDDWTALLTGLVGRWWTTSSGWSFGSSPVRSSEGGRASPAISPQTRSTRGLGSLVGYPTSTDCDGASLVREFGGTEE